MTDSAVKRADNYWQEKRSYSDMGQKGMKEPRIKRYWTVFVVLSAGIEPTQYCCRGILEEVLEMVKTLQE